MTCHVVGVVSAESYCHRLEAFSRDIVNPALSYEAGLIDISILVYSL